MSSNGHKVIEYKALPQTHEDWARLRKALIGVKGFIPPPALGVSAVAESEGEIIGAAVLQFVPYLGPFWIHPAYRGKDIVDYRELKQVIDGQFNKIGGQALIIQGYIALTDDEALIKMGEDCGMQRLNCVTLLNTIDEENGLPQR